MYCHSISCHVFYDYAFLIFHPVLYSRGTKLRNKATRTYGRILQARRAAAAPSARTGSCGGATARARAEPASAATPGAAQAAAAPSARTGSSGSCGGATARRARPRRRRARRTSAPPCDTATTGTLGAASALHGFTARNVCESVRNIHVSHCFTDSRCESVRNVRETCAKRPRNVRNVLRNVRNVLRIRVVDPLHLGFRRASSGPQEVSSSTLVRADRLHEEGDEANRYVRYGG